MTRTRILWTNLLASFLIAAPLPAGSKEIPNWVRSLWSSEPQCSRATFESYVFVRLQAYAETEGMVRIARDVSAVIEKNVKAGDVTAVLDKGYALYADACSRGQQVYMGIIVGEQASGILCHTKYLTAEGELVGYDKAPPLRSMGSDP